MSKSDEWDKKEKDHIYIKKSDLRKIVLVSIVLGAGIVLLIEGILGI